MVRLASAFAFGIGFVVKIERQHLILLKGSGKDVVGVTVFALGQLFEKAVTFSEFAIFRRAEIQTESQRQLVQPLQPFARLNQAVNGADRDHHQHRHNHKWHDEWHLGLHAAVLNQSRQPGHYNFNRFLHTVR